MSQRLPPLNALKAFEAAARHLSVKKAAVELNVTPAAVSHQIRTLEEYLDVQLFHRYNRALELTDAARACLPKLREGFDCLGQAVERLRTHTSRGMLTVSAAPSFAARWLMPRLHRFIAAHQEIDVRVSARMRRVSVDGKVDVAERATIETWLDDSDVAILYGHGHYPELDVHKLLSLTITPICSPQLLSGEHPLRTPEDLRHHMLLHDDTGDMYDSESFWEVWLDAAGVKGIDAKRGAHFSHAVLAFEAAMDAVGVVASMPALAAEDLAAGKLVMPFDLKVPLPSAYYLVCEPHARTRPAVAAFRDWLIAEAAKDPANQPVV
ncbi:MAG: transcriptional regulator GcvA [Betaproteobacteria bacterium]|nr:transcriptional regulator GcvA [Betaproteobacteria bacterium]